VRPFASLLVSCLAGLLVACGTGSGEVGGATDASLDGGDAGSVPGPAELRLGLAGVHALGSARRTVSLPNAHMHGDGSDYALFAIVDDGTVEPAMDLPDGYLLPAVQFVVRSPVTDHAFVSFAAPVAEPAIDPETGHATAGPILGSLFRVDGDGALTPIIDAEGSVSSRRPSAESGIGEAFKDPDPYAFDAEGNLYVIWRDRPTDDGHVFQRLIRYDPTEDRVTEVSPVGDRQVAQVWGFEMGRDGGSLLVVRSVTFLDEITDAGIPLRQLRLDLHRLPSLDTPVEVLAPEDDVAWIRGMQLSPSGDAVFFAGHRLGALSGVGRVDVPAGGAVTPSLLYGIQSSYAPVNYTHHSHDHTEGLFDREYDDVAMTWRLRFADRWFVGGDRTSGQLDHDAIMAALAPLFATSVTFSFGGHTGPDALDAFLAEEPYSWEDILGFPAPASFDSVFDDYYSWHFLETYFVTAGTTTPATTFASFVEAHGLVDVHLASYLFHVREVFFDASGALWALVQSEWDDATQRFRIMQPVRILDADGHRALAVLPAIADGDFETDAYRLGRDGRHVYLLARHPSGELEASGAHRIYRFDPSESPVTLEDMMVEVTGGDLVVRDFSVGHQTLYFAASRSGEEAGGLIDLETLEFTPFQSDVELETVDPLDEPAAPADPQDGGMPDAGG
jgi:hypothetical protein